MRAILWVLFFLGDVAFAQTVADQNLIASSQTGASTVFFKAKKANALVLPSTYSNPTEINVRKGLTHFFAKAHNY